MTFATEITGQPMPVTMRSIKTNIALNTCTQLGWREKEEKWRICLKPPTKQYSNVTLSWQISDTLAHVHMFWCGMVKITVIDMLYISIIESQNTHAQPQTLGLLAFHFSNAQSMT